jgi:predicted RNA polymerase sigma factor
MSNCWSTMAQRISRARQLIRQELEERLRAVLHVLYLIFNEGYTTSAGDAVNRTDLTREPVRLTRALHLTRPGDPEVKGLLALVPPTEARRAARTDPDGNIVQLADLDRSRWNQALIARGLPTRHRRPPAWPPRRRSDPGGHRRNPRRSPYRHVPTPSGAGASRPVSSWLIA